MLVLVHHATGHGLTRNSTLACSSVYSLDHPSTGDQLRAERAIRPAVVCRKLWGGNRTWAGAGTWQVPTSVLRTASQQGCDPIELLAHLLRAPGPIVAGLAIPGTDRHPTPSTRPDPVDARAHALARTEAVTT